MAADDQHDVFLPRPLKAPVLIELIGAAGVGEEIDLLPFFPLRQFPKQFGADALHAQILVRGQKADFAVGVVASFVGLKHFSVGVVIRLHAPFDESVLDEIDESHVEPLEGAQFEFPLALHVGQEQARELLAAITGDDLRGF